MSKVSAHLHSCTGDMCTVHLHSSSSKVSDVQVVQATENQAACSILVLSRLHDLTFIEFRNVQVVQATENQAVRVRS